MTSLICKGTVRRVRFWEIGFMTKVRKKVLKGVPRLGWGMDIECTFYGALDATLRYLGEVVDYVYLMGVSGAAFRLRFHQPDWCPSSPDAALDETYVKPALRFVGYSGQFVSETSRPDEIKRVVMEEIDQGIPVVAINLVRVPDWGVVTGYQNGNLLCRSYYDQGDEYSVAEKDPWSILKLEKVKSAPNRLECIRESFRLAAELAHKEKIDDYVNGLAAYDAWIKDLENEDLFNKLDEAAFHHYWHVNGWVYDSLFDARLAAARYLRRVTEEFQTKEKQVISKAAEQFDSIMKALFDKWIYFPFPHWVKKEEGITWTPKGMIDTTTWTTEMRKNGAEELRRIKGKEEDAFETLSKVF